jgi:hypothetical protein
MNANAYKCSYEEIVTEWGGFLKKRSKKFSSFRDAVDFSRMIANTNINIIGKPVIIIGKEHSE